jgi:hypothetical protein
MHRKYFTVLNTQQWKKEKIMAFDLLQQQEEEDDDD